MSGTKEFEEWARNEILGKVSATHDWRGMTDTQAAHFWLSTFVQLVRQEAERLPFAFDSTDQIGRAFNTVCQRFGLEKEIK